MAPGRVIGEELAGGGAAERAGLLPELGFALLGSVAQARRRGDRRQRPVSPVVLLLVTSVRQGGRGGDDYDTQAEQKHRQRHPGVGRDLQESF